MQQFTHKAIYHTVENSEKVKNIQLCIDKEHAEHITRMNTFHDFTPAYVEDNIEVDPDMYHIGDVAPQVHTGHYIESKSKYSRR